jgi:hypothetical protein
MKPYYDEGGITIYHADCREILPDTGPDVLVTDPPFNVGKDYETTNDSLPMAEYEALMDFVASRGPDSQAWVTPSNRLLLFCQKLGTDARPVVIRRGAQVRSGGLV